MKLALIGVTSFLTTSVAIASEQHHRTVVFLQQNTLGVQEMFSELKDRSNPESVNYLNWLSKNEVEDLLRPEAKHIESVLNLAKKSKADEINMLGGQKMEVFHLSKISHINFVKNVQETDGVDFVSTKTSRSFEISHASIRRARNGVPKNETLNIVGDPQSCLGSLLGVTPTCLRSAYGLNNSSRVKEKKEQEGGQAFIVNEAFSPSDLSHFQSEFKLSLNPVKNIVGPNSGKVGDEASLDSQYITTTGSDIETTFVFIDGSMSNPFTDWLVWAGNATNVPKVHSLSVGAPESEVGDQIISRMNNEMAALGVRGITVVFASGDGGYSPVLKYGASSPYVLSVGGVFNGELRDSPLQADSLTTGGFSSSSLNNVQSWQEAAIASYSRNRKPNSLPKIIPTNARAVPDLSAYDDDLSIVMNGQNSGISGTSAACPIVAGMLAKINEELEAQHGTSLGFVNPFIYKNENVFLDITKGGNRGIEAVEGYDPVSGVGTFGVTTFENLKRAALKAAGEASKARNAAAASK